MSPIEILATLLGIANVALIVRRSVWNYPFGLAMVLLYGKIFFDARLYSDAGLQVFFFVVQGLGWWAWARNETENGAVIVRVLTGQRRLLWAAGALAATGIWGWFMQHNTDASYPYWDAGIAMFSVAAQILMTRRFIENWHGWIAVNCASIPLYLIKGLHLTAGLYALFLGMAIWGLIEWRRAAQGQSPA